MRSTRALQSRTRPPQNTNSFTPTSAAIRVTAAKIGSRPTRSNRKVPADQHGVFGQLVERHGAPRKRRPSETHIVLYTETNARGAPSIRVKPMKLCLLFSSNLRYCRIFRCQPWVGQLSS